MKPNRQSVHGIPSGWRGKYEKKQCKNEQWQQLYNSKKTENVLKFSKFTRFYRNIAACLWNLREFAELKKNSETSWKFAPPQNRRRWSRYFDTFMIFWYSGPLQNRNENTTTEYLDLKICSQPSLQASFVFYRHFLAYYVASFFNDFSFRNVCSLKKTQQSGTFPVSVVDTS